jgi:hypothetical protein
VSFDIDFDRDFAQSIPYGEVSMGSEAFMDDGCFSEAPLKPRRLHFSEAFSSQGDAEELKRPEVPSKLVEGLAKAFLLMVGRRARLDLQMQVTKAKVDQLNGDEGGELVIPPDICGDFTIVRYFNLEPICATSVIEQPVSRLRRVINKDIEASSIAAPNHSLASKVANSQKRRSLIAVIKSRP